MRLRSSLGIAVLCYGAPASSTSPMTWSPPHHNLCALLRCACSEHAEVEDVADVELIDQKQTAKGSSVDDDDEVRVGRTY